MFNATVGLVSFSKPFGSLGVPRPVIAYMFAMVPASAPVGTEILALESLLTNVLIPNLL